MIQNKIYNINVEDVDKIVQEANASNNLHLAEVQGKEIQSWKDYIKKIENIFKFPTSCTNNIDRYLDWIRDLDWLKKDSYILIIYDYKSFLEQDLSLKKNDNG
jgi:hypothetical protein